MVSKLVGLNPKDSLVPELSNKVMEEDGSFQPGQVKPRAQPLSTSKRSEAATAHVFVLEGPPQFHY